MTPLAALGIDPFSGRPLEYQVQGKRYQLRSIGPVAEEEDSRAVNGRVPVMLER